MNRSFSGIQRASRRVLAVSTLLVSAIGCGNDSSLGAEEDLRSVAAELTLAQRMTRYSQIRDAAAARGIDHTGYLLAGIAYAETGLAHCWSEATWACQGPGSADCGGGPVIAGASDGPCSAQQGGLGMFQFDAGTFTDTLNAYGSDVLTVAGNTNHAIDYAINMVKISAYTTNAETDAKALQWIINFDINNSTLRDQWIKSVTHYYNGCAPSYSCWSQRYAHYNDSLQSVIDETGLAFWAVSACTCSPGQAQQEACGACGVRSRSCDSNCHWGNWGGCVGEGACSPGATTSEGCGNCGSHSRTCNSGCQWEPWTSCTGQGPCSPGQLGQETCGDCGTHARSCTSACQWGNWGECQGQGECSPGATEQQPCCDCGTHSRTCSSACSWGAFGVCDGPDPAGGKQECNTGEPGPCAAGIVRCVSGCSACRRAYEPQPERCDDIDNDCSGESDEGQPAILGTPPPKLAARLVDVAMPQSMSAGERGSAWLVFRNEGQLTWDRGSLWLEATSTWKDKPSPLHDRESWPAYDVAALLDEVVAPGEEVLFPFMILARDDAQTTISETFQLVDRGGTALKCPSAGYTAAVRINATAGVSQIPSLTHPLSADSEGGCSVSPTHGTPAGWTASALFLGMWGMALIRRRKTLLVIALGR